MKIISVILISSSITAIILKTENKRIVFISLLFYTLGVAALIADIMEVIK